MRYLTLILLLFTIGAVSAQDWAKAKLEKSPRHREWVSIKHDGRSVETFVAYPESKDKTPVVLVIHEIFGMTDWVQDLADQVAEAGYIAVAPDLLSGMGPNGGRSSSFAEGKATEAVSHLNPDQVTADLNAAADYGRKLPASNGKLFVVGFCWGGAQSFRFATNRPDLSAAFVFYGAPPDKDAMGRITAPVYGFYAGNDARIDATLPDTIQSMKAAGKKFDPLTYEGAGHGFMRAGEAPDASDANRKARDQAWARWKSVLVESSRADYVPDEKTAERVAEAVLIGQFGEDRVKEQLPLHARSWGEGNQYWVVAAKPLFDSQGNPSTAGGGFGVLIKKHDGCLSVVEHMKF